MQIFKLTVLCGHLETVDNFWLFDEFLDDLELDTPKLQSLDWSTCVFLSVRTSFSILKNLNIVYLATSNLT